MELKKAKEEIEYKSIINKPRQLINIDRTGFGIVECKLFDILLHKCQVELYISRESKEEKLNEQYNKWYEIEISEVFKQMDSSKNYKYGNYQELKLLIDTFGELKITSFDEINIMENIIIFPNLKFDRSVGRLSYKLNTEVINAYWDESYIIGDYKKSDKKESFTARYVGYDFVKLNSRKLSVYSRIVYETLLSQSWNMLTNSVRIYYPFEEFKKLISIDSSIEDNVYIRNKIIKNKIEKELLANDIEFRYEYKKGFRGKIDGIYIWIDDIKNCKNPDVIKAMKKEKDKSLESEKTEKIVSSLPEDDWGKSKIEISPKPIIDVYYDDFNPFEQKLPYELINKEKSELYLNTIIKDSQFSRLISMRICNAMNYDAYESLLLGNIDNKDVRNKVNSDEFARGYRFRYYKDVAECQDKNLIETEMVMLGCLDVNVLQEIADTDSYSRYKYLMDSYNLSVQSEKMFNKGFRSNFDEDLF